jgi:nicotinamidase-related amidase
MMRRGLRPKDGSRGRAAVLALDLITDFDFPDGPAVLRALTARAPALHKLMARARRSGVPVIYANDNLGEWRSDAPALISHCTQPHRPGASLVKSLLPDRKDCIVLKPRHSAFYGTALEALLEERRVRTLLITGISAESCVWMTACDAHTRAFNLVIPEDTMAAVTPQGLRLSLQGLRDVLGARVPKNAASVRLSGKSRVE